MAIVKVMPRGQVMYSNNIGTNAFPIPYANSGGFHNHLSWLQFNPNKFMQNYSSFTHVFQECLKQNI